ncbi:uncharacterized protein LOC143922984 [Arctopsyche grandis]|uniref:uncharacterized protein LOC143922984 n=1 Tax=Arctopsyche grandis TaxID=121162 RepID=UPI00406D9673
MARRMLLLGAILALGGCGQTLTICDEEACSCDGFSRVSCSCTLPHQEITVRPEGAYKILPSATSLEIYNCSRVYIIPNAIQGLRELKAVKLSGIDSLTLSENSLQWAREFNNIPGLDNGIKISIQKTTMEEIPSYAIKGNIKEVIFDTLIIHKIRSFALSSITDMSMIKITNSTIHNVEAQAFKKFSLGMILIKQNSFKELPSRMFSDLKVSGEFLFDGNSVERIRSSFCIVKGLRKLKFENCNVRIIDGESFRVVMNGPVLIQNNTIGELKAKSFYGISVFKEVTDRQGLMDFEIWNNTVSSLEVNALDVNTTSFKLSTRDLLVDQKCNCNQWYFHIDLTVLNSLLCNFEGQYYLLKDYKDANCAVEKINTALLSVIIISCIAIIAAVVLIIVLLVRKYCGKSIYCLNKKSDRLNVIVPDGKTYKETQLYVVVEKAELLTTNL